MDEANIEPLIRGQGYKALYAPQAIVNNKGPETVKQFDGNENFSELLRQSLVQ